MGRGRWTPRRQAFSGRTESGPAASRFAARFVTSAVGACDDASAAATLITVVAGMAFLMIGGERFALPIGDTTLGGDADELFRGSALFASVPFAILTADEESMTLRAVAGVDTVRVNDRALGADPRVLRHGDRIEFGDLILHAGDLRAAGRTARARGVSDADLDAAPVMTATNPTAATGGRLIRADDGSSQDIADRGIVIGRDPDCDVIIDSHEVSRRHATITPTLLGYTLRDESTNGMLVNGERAERSHLLSQGDVLRVGDVIFRFSADSASYEPDPAIWRSPLAPLAAAIEPPTACTTPGVAGEQSPETAPTGKQARSVAPAPEARVLATLDVLAGRVPVGMRFQLERPVAQIGRGTASDVCLIDDSVSGAHATLMLRGPAWHIIDHGSRNGTYVDGKRVAECLIRGPCELRLGAVTLYFTPLRAPASESVGTLGLIDVEHAKDSGKPR